MAMALGTPAALACGQGLNLSISSSLKVGSSNRPGMQGSLSGQKLTVGNNSVKGELH
jgi:hypothetical protein